MSSQGHEHLGTRLDRLVDGELSGEEYRALLGELERDPVGWRQCALAFLESQALRGDLGKLSESDIGRSRSMGIPKRISPGAPDGALRPATAAAQTPRAPSPSFWLTLAASWLIVFGLGTWAARLWRDSPSAPLDHAGVVPTPDRIANSPPALTPVGPEDAREGNSDLFAEVVMPGVEGQGQQVFRLPIDPTRDMAQLLAEQPDDLSPSTRGLLRKKGFDVRRGQRYLYPFTMPNGRSMVVPVDSYQFVPIRNAY